MVLQEKLVIKINFTGCRVLASDRIISQLKLCYWLSLNVLTMSSMSNLYNLYSLIYVDGNWKCGCTVKTFSIIL